MTPEFSPVDRSTWPELMTLEQIAAIWQRKPGGLAHSIYQRTFIPAPIHHGSKLVRPMRWRRSDVTRYLDGQSGVRGLVRSA